MAHRKGNEMTAEHRRFEEEGKLEYLEKCFVKFSNIRHASHARVCEEEVVRGCVVLCGDGAAGSQSSGLLAGRRWALTTAAVLGPLLQERRAELRYACAALPPDGRLAVPPDLSVLPREASTFAVGGVRAAPRAAWRCPLLSRALLQLLDGWALGDQDDAESEVVRALLPVFLLLEVVDVDDDPGGGEAPEDVLRRLAGLVHAAPARGGRVLVEATPFCSRFFLNSLSQGIVSNVLGPRGCLLLTDARTTHGCEGGPIFSVMEAGKQLIGMVACSLTWWRGEWVGFTLAVLLSPVLHHLLVSQSPVTIPVPIASMKDTLGLDDAVIVVRCGSGWGSGVVVDKSKGTIITCSHVVSQADKYPVTVQWKARRLPAQLLYRTKDGVAFDVAVLSVGPVAGLQQLELATGAPVVGEEVLAAGFPIFSETGLLPTISHGVVAHVEGDAPFFLQTTCCVQSGASGGAVLHQSGQLLAMIVCNIKDHGTGAIYPEVNLAVPSAVLAIPLAQFAATGDLKSLSSLECDDPEIQRTWRLQSITSKL